MIQALDGIFSRPKVEFKVALNKISSTGNQSMKEGVAFWLRNDENVSI